MLLNSQDPSKRGLLFLQSVKATLLFSSLHGTQIALSYRPDFDAASQKAVWQVLGHEATDTHAVTPNEKIKILKDNTLVIKDIDVDDAGESFVKR